MFRPARRGSTESLKRPSAVSAYAAELSSHAWSAGLQIAARRPPRRLEEVGQRREIGPKAPSTRIM